MLLTCENCGHEPCTEWCRVDAKPKRIKRMHVMDAGEIHGKLAARFYCERCETETGWYECSKTEAKRGLPCPECNTPPLGEGIS